MIVYQLSTMEKSIVLIVVKRYEDLEYHYCNCKGAIKEIEVRKEIDVAERGSV